MDVNASKKERRQVNKNSLNSENGEYRDGIKSKVTRASVCDAVVLVIMAPYSNSHCVLVKSFLQTTPILLSPLLLMT